MVFVAALEACIYLTLTITYDTSDKKYCLISYLEVLLGLIIFGTSWYSLIFCVLRTSSDLK